MTVAIFLLKICQCNRHEKGGYFAGYYFLGFKKHRYLILSMLETLPPATPLVFITFLSPDEMNSAHLHQHVKVKKPV